MRSGAGYRSACISMESLGEDLMAPVIASAAVRCVWAILLVAPIDPRIGLLVSLSYVGRSHILAAYSVRGMATALYNWRISFVGIP